MKNRERSGEMQTTGLDTLQTAGLEAVRLPLCVRESDDVGVVDFWIYLDQ